MPPPSPEFALIAKYFTRPTKRAALGIGDDCALIDVTPGKQLAISTDTLVAGVHFFLDTAAEALGHKALAVNLSDLAAMGAMPKFFTLALTLPQVNDVWLSDFARGLFRLADQYEIELIGGDTTKGPLSMTLTVMGQVAPHVALRRDAAKLGDDIWVSGTLGGAALALKHLQGAVSLKPNVLPRALTRLHTPEPRVALGLRLVSVANAAIDISDGLIADLGHICARSQLTASIDWAKIPLHPALLSVSPDIRMQSALAGGDDYELCFTAPLSAHEKIRTMSDDMDLSLRNIGTMREMENTPTIVVIDERGREMTAADMGLAGFDHFLSAT
jgi:thiamine-monophosphate kinase